MQLEDLKNIYKSLNPVSLISQRTISNNVEVSAVVNV